MGTGFKVFNKTLKFFIFLAAFEVFSYGAYAGVHFIVKSDNSAAPTETKSCWQKGYRLSFCPSGGCPQCKDVNGVTYYKAPACDTTGYINSCPAGQIGDETTKLGCDNSYFRSCKCGDDYKYGPGRLTCNSTPGGGSCTSAGNTYYKTCECSADYKYTCDASVGQVPVNASDSCGGKYKACKCVTSSVPTGQRCTQKTSNGLTCYIDCKEDVKTCESGKYLSEIPMNKICKEVKYEGLTCYKDCNKQATCEDFNYYSNIAIRFKSCEKITPKRTTLTCYNKCVWKPEYQCNKERCKNVCGTSKCVGSMVGDGICSMVDNGGCSMINDGACSMVDNGGLSMVDDGGCSMVDNGGCSMVDDGGCSMLGNRENKCPSSC